MRIAQISTLGTPVRRNGSGSVEGLVWQLSHELTEAGHEVTVFGAAGSEADAEVVTTLPGTYGDGVAPGDWQLCEWVNLCRAVEQSGRFDVIHSHSYLYGLPLQELSKAPMVHTLHLTGDEEYARLWGLYPDACVTAISEYQWSAFPDLKPTAVIHHGVSPSWFRPNLEPEDYVCYLGRFTPGKGPLQAIETAKALGLRLILAGPRNDYFRNRIEPLVDGRHVEYVGGIGGQRKHDLLARARALLYPIRDPEPFGLVLIEAMMCGTPVAAVGVGAVSEIIDRGVTGHYASTAGEFPGAVLEALALDRRRVRECAEARFSSRRMAREYERVFEHAARPATLRV